MLKEVLMALVVLMVTLPVVEHFDPTDFSETVLLIPVLISAALAVGAQRRNLLIGIVLVVPAIAGKWLLTFAPNHQFNHLLYVIPFGLGAVFVAFVIWHLLEFILRSPQVDAEVMCAGIGAYLMLGLLWMFAYSLIWRINPGAFAFSTGSTVMKGSTALYFSFITLTTVGYGDITPVSRVARMLAAAEAMTGTLFIAVMISRLVSLYSSRPKNSPKNS
jgi:voltage-gated potassium channel Kch